MKSYGIVSPDDINKDFLLALHAILLAANACRRMAPPPGKGPSIAFAAAVNLITLIEKLKTENQPADWKMAKKAAKTLREIIVGKDKHKLGVELTADELDHLENRLIGLYGEISAIIPPDKIPNDDELRNINSFEYLRNIAALIPESLRDDVGFAEVWNACQPDMQYDIDIPYGNFYTQFLIALEAKILDPLFKKDLPLLDELIDTVYKNQNFALERAYLMNKEELGKVRQADYKKAEKKIRQRLKQPAASRKGGKNIDSPVGAGSGLMLVISNVLPWFKPMTTTSQPSMVHFAYKTSADSQQLRFGTQGQIVGYRKHINPIFERWLEIQKELSIGRGKPITHIYFNNLSRTGGDEVAIDFKRKSREDSLTSELEKLEDRHTNIAMITMPSDGGMMNHHDITKRRAKLWGEDVFQKILAIANGTSTEPYGKELYISPRIRGMLFTSKQDESDQLKILLNNSFAALGFTRDQMLSRSDRQALYFHFIKFELANYIIDTIQPLTFNFSCKDAIDRGGVSSAYYNLIKSIEKGLPLSLNEFECILHGAPILVKGRPMNDHIMQIWNAIDAYLRAHPGDKKIPSWCTAWRDKHAPSEDTIHEVLQDKCVMELKKYIVKKENILKNPPAVKAKFTPQLKHELAVGLLDALEEHQKNHKNLRVSPCRLVIDKEKYAAFHNGELYKRIIMPLEKNGLLILEKTSLKVKLSINAHHDKVRRFEHIVNRMLASRRDIESIDRALTTCKHLQDRLKEFDNKLWDDDPGHGVLAKELKLLTGLQVKLDAAKVAYDDKSKPYSPKQVLSFSPDSIVVSAPPGQLDVKIAEVLAQGAQDAVHMGGFADTAPIDATEDFVRNKARVNFTDIETGVGLFKKSTTVKSVQLMRGDDFKSEIYFDPAQLSRFGTKGYLKWAMAEFNRFYHANPLPDRHMIIEGDLPEKFVRFSIALCQIMHVPYTNAVNKKFEPTSDDLKKVHHQLAKHHVSITSEIREVDDFLQKTAADVTAIPTTKIK